MADIVTLRAARRRAALRRGLALHRPRAGTAPPRTLDVVLAMVGVSLLGALALSAAILLAGRGLAP
ncbi:hypothetical protein [Methylobacterium sp. JK268]